MKEPVGPRNALEILRIDFTDLDSFSIRSGALVGLPHFESDFWVPIKGGALRRVSGLTRASELIG